MHIIKIKISIKISSFPLLWCFNGVRNNWHYKENGGHPPPEKK